MINKIRPLILCLTILTFAVPAFAGGCYWYTWKGTVVNNSEDEIQACIGAKDAVVGQELNIYKIIKDDPKSINGMGKVYTGKAVITQVSDGQVRAKIIAGKAETKAMVEVPPFFASPSPRLASSANR